MAKLVNRCFCWFPASTLQPLRGSPTWRLHGHLHFRWNISPNIWHRKNSMHINLGKSLCIFSFYIIRIQGYLLNDCDLYSRWRNTVKPAINMANDLPTRLDVLILRLASKHIVEAKYWWFSLWRRRKRKSKLWNVWSQEFQILYIEYRWMNDLAKSHVCAVFRSWVALQNA